MTPIALNNPELQGKAEDVVANTQTETRSLKDLSPAPESYLINAAQFRRVIEFSDEQCILRTRSEEIDNFGGQSEFLRSLKGQPAWVCQLDADVNLRSAIHLPVGYYQSHWIFAYRLEAGCRHLAGPAIQTYNCSMGKPLDTAMFWARTTDPSQPFISGNLNAIILPRRTSALEVPKYETLGLESLEGVVLRRQNEGEMVLNSGILHVEWDAPTVFLIKLILRRFLKGKLSFLGVVLVGSSSPIVDQVNYVDVEVR